MKTNYFLELLLLLSCSVMSDSLQPWTAAWEASLSFTKSQSLLKLMSIELCHLTISSSVDSFSSCPQSFPALGSFSMSQLFTSADQSIGASASATVLPVNIQGWFPWFELFAVQESSPTSQFKSINSPVRNFLYSPTLTTIHDYWKTTALTRWTFVGKVMSLLFNMLSRLVITFLPRSKHLLIS